MAITLGTITLPQGLRWEDEFTWAADTIENEYSITGALILDRGTKQSGRPITLIGGASFTWIKRVDLLVLQTLLESYTNDGITLTMHDARVFTVVPMTSPIETSPLPIVNGTGPANPSNTTWYSLDKLKLMEI